MKDLLDSIGNKVKSPIFGYTLLATSLINWKPIFYLLISSENVIDRFSYFDSHTSIFTLLVIPLSISIFGLLVQPWMSFIFLYIAQKPTYLRDVLLIDSEHELNIKRQKLEATRGHLLAQQEEELIERAERDSQIEEIGNQPTKEKLKGEIEELRRTRDKMKNAQFLDGGIEDFITIDLRPVNHDIIQIEPEQFDTLQSLLDWLFMNFLKNYVPAYTYGEEWTLVDVGTKTAILSKGRCDDRMLFDAGVLDGVVYRVELKN